MCSLTKSNPFLMRKHPKTGPPGRSRVDGSEQPTCTVCLRQTRQCPNAADDAHRLSDTISYERI